MKKVLMLVLALAMVLSFVACNKAGDDIAPTKAPTSVPEATAVPTTPVDAKIIALKGPTGMGMAKLMEDGYEIELVGDPTLVAPEVIKGNVDISSVPVNLAATLYQKTKGEIKIAAINTLGTLHVVEKGNTINSISDLKGKTVYYTGKGSTPEYALNYILTQNGIDPAKDIEIVYLSEHAELSAQMISGDVTLGILPEPFVTQTIAKNAEVRDAIDLSDEWDKVAENNSKLTMGCIIVSKDFAENHKDDLDLFLKQYEASINYVNGDVEKGSQLVAKHGIIPAAPVAKKAIPGCNMTFMAGDEMKSAAGGFLKVMFDADPKSIGGTMPDEAFYYMG